ncbi:hypothetical protein P168DRAFT_53037 [Aspergillus campestris IBT 28561]|uniref:Uncharacterized protein n=1 Tax=Aspergillus campestris (strain IBT 28561) TaxID=1392248 RepID=A0A2I1CVG4_ASPC2|nr:uncharacterized protein P168DRAFT_53037 [Aspergillus campestris IBT 28561]PKY01608.1 hypothetical protein P168DRAFT_53037 [Aspergillus campestris IBT 28561]
MELDELSSAQGSIVRVVIIQYYTKHILCTKYHKNGLDINTPLISVVIFIRWHLSRESGPSTAEYPPCRTAMPFLARIPREPKSRITNHGRWQISKCARYGPCIRYPLGRLGIIPIPVEGKNGTPSIPIQRPRMDKGVHRTEDTDRPLLDRRTKPA